MYMRNHFVLPAARTGTLSFSTKGDMFVLIHTLLVHDLQKVRSVQDEEVK